MVTRAGVVMSRRWAIRAWGYCSAWAAPRSGIVVAFGVLAAAIWLWVRTFPVYQQYEVISINGRAVTKYRPTFRVVLAMNGDTWARGWTGCNWWSARVESLRSGQIDFRSAYHTALACSRWAMQNEEEFDSALAKVTRWRREQAELFLEGDGVMLRLAPPTGTSFSEFGANPSPR